MAFEHERQASDRPVSVMVFDMPTLEQLEAKLGRREADQLLKAVAGRVGLASRRSCVLARIGRHTLAQVVPGLALQNAPAMANRLYQAINAETLTLGDGRQITLPVAVGFATSPDHGVTATQLCQRARRDAHASDLPDHASKSAG